MGWSQPRRTCAGARRAGRAEPRPPVPSRPPRPGTRRSRGPAPHSRPWPPRPAAPRSAHGGGEPAAARGARRGSGARADSRAAARRPPGPGPAASVRSPGRPAAARLTRWRRPARPAAGQLSATRRPGPRGSRSSPWGTPPSGGCCQGHLRRRFHRPRFWGFWPSRRRRPAPALWPVTSRSRCGERAVGVRQSASDASRLTSACPYTRSRSGGFPQVSGLIGAALLGQPRPRIMLAVAVIRGHRDGFAGRKTRLPRLRPIAR